MYKRVIIKLSGEALAGEKETGFCDSTIDRISAQVIEIMRKGVQAALVVGGGNFWRGRSGSGEMDRVKSDQIGMMATVMNALYLTERLRIRGVHSVVMTPTIIGVVTEQFSKDKALEYMKKGSVIIFACGTGHPFFSTDTIAAIRGAELEADALLFAKNIDGVYDSDPSLNGMARKLDHVTYKQILTDGLRVIDLAVCGICMELDMVSIIFGLHEPGGLLSAVSGDDNEIYRIGTKVTV
ncbi:MAG: uridine monophosphate kinase [Defluviitaleaceae bacterium]|nr:uridine monophosphate kinase [Defluviitaleaceae bacterium]MCL2835603.1 uridine monophosphate kinase [Defluviitaleaceae bacterium]